MDQQLQLFTALAFVFKTSSKAGTRAKISQLGAQTILSAHVSFALEDHLWDPSIQQDFPTGRV